MSNPAGRPPDIVREAWVLRYGLSKRQAAKLTQSMMAKLSCCKSEEARRILLWKSE